MIALGRWAVVLALLMGGCLVLAGRAWAQDPRAVALELSGGHAAFVDEGAIHHAVLGGAARWQLTPRVGIGPELVYMVGPGDDRDLFVTGNVTWDFVTRPRRSRTVIPYVVAGAGLFRHSDRVGTGTFASSEGAFTAGGGARVWVTPRVNVGAEARLGWELHTRLTGHLGIQLAR